MTAGPEDAGARAAAPPDEAEAGSLQPFVARAAECLRAVAAEADGAVAQIKHEAETGASHAEAQGGELAAERARTLQEFGAALAEYVGAVQQQCRDAVEILERVGGQLDAAAPLSGIGAGGDAAPPQRTRRFVREPSKASEGLRLLATQMALGGRSREEIASRLRAQFDLTDADELLDEIFGP